MATDHVGSSAVTVLQSPVFLYITNGPREKVSDEVLHRADCDTVVVDSRFAMEISGKAVSGADLKERIEAYGSRIVMTDKPVVLLVLMDKDEPIDLSPVPTYCNVYFPMGGALVETVRTFLGQKNFVSGVSEVYEAVAKLTISLRTGLSALNRAAPTSSLVTGVVVDEPTAVTSSGRGVAQAYLEAASAVVPNLDDKLKKVLNEQRIKK